MTKTKKERETMPATLTKTTKTEAGTKTDTGAGTDRQYY
jgi:hypothetical protein